MCRRSKSIQNNCFLTFPVTVTTVERLFSKLKLIKSDLWSTICGLGILSIKNDRARQLNVKEIANNFAEKSTQTKFSLNYYYYILINRYIMLFYLDVISSYLL